MCSIPSHRSSPGFNNNRGYLSQYAQREAQAVDVDAREDDVYQPDHQRDFDRQGRHPELADASAISRSRQSEASERGEQEQIRDHHRAAEETSYSRGGGNETRQRGCGDEHQREVGELYRPDGGHRLGRLGGHFQQLDQVDGAADKSEHESYQRQRRCGMEIFIGEIADRAAGNRRGSKLHRSGKI